MIRRTSIPRWIEATVLAVAAVAVLTLVWRSPILVAAAPVVLLGFALLVWIVLRYRLADAVATVAANEERLQLALEGAEDGIWDWDLESQQVTFNSRWLAMLGYEPGEVESSWDGWMQLIHPDDVAGVKKALDAHLAGQIPLYQTEHRMRAHSGDWRWILARGKVVERGEDDRPRRMSGTHKDITERKRAREALIRSEALIRAIVDTAPDGIVTINEQGSVESFNAAAERIFGYAAAEILGRNVRLLMPAPDREHHDEYLARYLTTGRARILGRTREVLGCRRDSTSFPMEISIGEARLRDHRLFTGIVRDVTARKEAEENLKLYRAIVENTNEGVELVRMRDEVIVYVNPALEQMFEYARGELVGKHVGILYAADDKGTRDFLRKITETLGTESAWRGETRALKRSGRIFWCRTRISTFDHPKYGPVWVSLHEDITAQMRIEDERHRLAEQLRQTRSSEVVTLASTRRQEAAAPVLAGPLPGSGDETVLVAEDDDVVREMAVRILEHGGYTVLEARNGAEAIRVFEEHGDEVDLVLLDVIMPVMSGLAACQQIRKIRPDVRVLLSSGYTSATKHRDASGEEVPLVAKPFDYDHLLARIREVLDGP